MKSALALLLIGPLSVAAGGAERDTEALINCVVAAGSGGRALAVVSRSLEGKPSFQFHFKSRAGQWEQGLRYVAAVTALVLQGDHLYALGAGGAAVYDVTGTIGPDEADAVGKRGRWLRRLTWEPTWQPLAATALGHELWAFGTVDGTITAAALKDDAWVERQEAVLAEAAVSRSRLWVAGPQAGGGAPVQLLWFSEAIPDQGSIIRRALFDGVEWDFLPSLSAPGDAHELAAAINGDLLTVFALNSAHSITEKYPLLYSEVPASGTGTVRSEAEFLPVAGVRDGRFNRTHTLAAAAAEGTVALFLVSHGTVDSVTVEGGRASARLSIEKVPLLQRLETKLLSGLMAAAYLVFLGLSIRRARRWPRIVQSENCEMTLASWQARVGAYCVDLALAAVFVGLVAVMTGGMDWETLALAYRPLFLIPYFILLELRHGQTPGKALFGIAVVTLDLRRPGMKHVVVRNLLRVIDNPLVGLIILLNVSTFQRLGDLLAGTLVVKVPLGAAESNTT